MLVQRILSIWSSRIRRAGQYIGVFANNDDIRSVAATGSFRMIPETRVSIIRSPDPRPKKQDLRMNSTALECCNGTLDEARFIQSICVNVDLPVRKGSDRAFSAC
jgi:hypothetical protein